MIAVPEQVKSILTRLNAAGFAAYAVGGCVRDSLLGRPVHDWDICTAARPEEMPGCFAGERLLPTGVQHGTMTLLQNGEPFEITTFRCDGDYTDHRRPDSVRFVRELELDLARRDFTVNAMACDAAGRVFDPFGGQNDLRNGVLRCVGEPQKRLNEDALRILRALRFAANYNFKIEPATAKAMVELKDTLCRVSAERILQELRRLLPAAAAGRVLEEFYPVVWVFLPELPENFALRQAFACCPAEETLRFALLLSPLAREDSESALRRLRAENALCRGVGEVLELLSLPLPEDLPALKRQAARFGPATLRTALQVRQAKGEDTTALLERLQQLEEENACLSVKQLAVNGRELLSLGFTGKEIGAVQQFLLNAVLEGAKNEKEVLLTLAAEYKK